MGFLIKLARSSAPDFMDRKFSPVLTIKAVKLVRDRGVTVTPAARDLDVHINVLRKWLRKAKFDPESALLEQRYETGATGD